MTVVKDFKKMFIVTLVAIFVLFTVIHFVKVCADDNANLNKYYKSYTIKKGDTLYSIAQDNTVDTNISVEKYIDDLKDDNNIDNCDDIKEGNKLIITYYAQ